MSYRAFQATSSSALLFAFASLLLPGEALAHAHLVAATPAAEAMAMPAPTELRLKFSEGIEIKFSSVTLKGPDHATIKTGPQRLDPKDDTVLIVPVPATLVDGTYTVDWHALSTDGHKTKGSYHFDSMQ